MVRNVVRPATNSVRTLLPDLLRLNIRSRKRGALCVSVAAAWLMTLPLPWRILVDQRKPSIATAGKSFERIFLSRTREARRLRRSPILDKKSFRNTDSHCDRRRTATSGTYLGAVRDQRAGVAAADESTGRITPQPTRNSGSRPCTRRSKVCGTSGMRSGKRALMSAGGVGVVSDVSQTTTAPLARMSAGVTEGERAGSSSKYTLGRLGAQ